MRSGPGSFSLRPLLPHLDSAIDQARTFVVATTNDIPASWAMTRVDQVGSVRTGLQRSPDRQTGRHATRYLRAANVAPTGLDLSDLREMDFTPKERVVFGLLPGDILLTEGSGSATQVGRAAVWAGEIEDCCYQNTLIRFRPHAVLPEYALLVFRHYLAEGVLARTARGVGIQHLGASRFAALPFPLPPLSEQERIAHEAERKLVQIREAGTRLEHATSNLAAQTREIVAAATTAALVRSSGEGILDDESNGNTHHPVQSDNPALAETIRHLRFNPIPLNWSWTTVGKAGTAKLGRQRSPVHHLGPNMRPYLRVANVFDDRIDTSDLLEMNFEPSEASEYELASGDVLLNEGQSPDLVGRAAIYRGEVPGSCFQNTLIRFRAYPGVEPEFALLVFRQYLYSGIFRKVARWSTNIAHLGLRRFRALPFPLPPLEEQKLTADEARRRLDATASQVSAVQASLARLPDMERELLAAAVTGQLAPQDPGDESAHVLLKRLGPPPTSPGRRRQTTGDDDQVPSTSRPSRLRADPAMLRADPAIDFTAVLRESGGALPIRELFARADFDRDSTEDVECFYLALRAQLGRSIRVKEGGAGDENIIVEVLSAD